MAKKKKPAIGVKKWRQSDSPSFGTATPQVYTLDVFITGGPISTEFAKKNRVISRTIQNRGDQTLEDLHDAIFTAFDRFDSHMYEFRFGKRPMEGPTYVLSAAAGVGNDDPAGTVEETTLGSLGLTKSQSFGYWFDFGDDWWHQINVNAIEADVPAGKYPKITKRVGKSPPQYLDEEELSDPAGDEA